MFYSSSNIVSGPYQALLQKPLQTRNGGRRLTRSSKHGPEQQVPQWSWTPSVVRILLSSPSLNLEYPFCASALSIGVPQSVFYSVYVELLWCHGWWLKSDPKFHVIIWPLCPFLICTQFVGEWQWYHNGLDALLFALLFFLWKHGLVLFGW